MANPLPIMLMLLNQIRIFPLPTNAELRMALLEVSSIVTLFFHNQPENPKMLMLLKKIRKSIRHPSLMMPLASY
jgi:hypothetical protein